MSFYDVFVIFYTYLCKNFDVFYFSILSMKTYLFILLFVLVPSFSYSQSNAFDDFFEKLYLRIYKNEEHVLKFIADGVELDGQLQYTGTKVFVMQGPNTTLTATQLSNKNREMFVVNLDSGIVTLKKAQLVFYDKTEESLQEAQKMSEKSIESQNDGLGISFDVPIEIEGNHGMIESIESTVPKEVTPAERKDETTRYTNALTNCQKNLREMDKIIAVYDTCGRQSLLIRYDSIAQTNESLLDGIDKEYVIYNQRLHKLENDYMSRLAHVQAKHDSIVNYLPSMVEADGFSFLVNTDNKEVILYHPIDKTLSKYEVPSTIDYRIHTLKVVGIGTYAFENLTQITEIRLPSTITEIRHRAFAGCENLKSIQLSENLKSMGEEVFLDCKSLQSISLPKALMSIEQLAFSKCTGLKEVVAEMSNPASLGDNVFDTTKTNNALLILQNGSFDQYLNSDWASYFLNIKEQFTESIKSAHLLTDSHTFLIKSNGTAEFLSSPIKPYQDDFIVPEKIFNNSYTVTGIGANAFYNQEALKKVILPNTIEFIGDSAFAFCRSLNQIQLPASLEAIGEKAFYVCKKLHSIDLPNGLKTIKNSAFAFCSGLESIYFPYGITTISDMVCQDCHHLQSIGIPASVEVIGENAFRNCKELQTLTLVNGVKTINRGAFSGCQGLIVVDLPQSVGLLADDCFGGCDDISAIYFQGMYPPECASNAFSINVIDAVLYVPDKADKAYEALDFKSKGFSKIKDLPNEEKLEKHKAKSLEEGLEDVAKKPRLREKRLQKEARQRDKQENKEFVF